MRRQATRQDQQKNFENGRRPNVGCIQQEAVLAVEHEELLAGQPLALGAPCLVGFAAVKLPSSGTFVVVGHGAGVL